VDAVCARTLSQNSRVANKAQGRVLEVIVSGSERTSKSKQLPVATKGGLILEVPRSNFHQDETKSSGLDNANGQGGSDFLALIAKGIKPSGERKKYHRFAAPSSFAGKDAEQRLGGTLQQHTSLYNQSLIRLVSCG